MNLTLDLFDCNARIGRYGTKHPEAFTSADQLMDEMDYCGISRALVHHALSREYDPSVGNEVLLREIEGKPFDPCWVVMPHHTGEVPAPTDLLTHMQRVGVRALRAFPILHQFSLSDWCCGDLLDMMESHSIPFFLEFDQTNWEEIASLLSNHPDLNLVLLQTSYRIDRFVYPLFDKFPNLRIETATYQPNKGIEEITRRFGAERLLFGSDLPITEAGPSIAQIAYAEISDREKELIAGGNLEIARLVLK